MTHVVRRVSAASGVDGFVVATSVEPADDAIEAACAASGWPIVRGPEQDVLARFASAVRATDAETLVRVTSDCPLFPPLVLDEMPVRFHPARMDYMSTNYPERSLPVGLDCEVMRTDRLLEADAEATDPYDREHVTPFLYRHPERFRLAGYALSGDLSNIRTKLHTTEDYDRIFGFPQIIKYDERHALCRGSRFPRWRNTIAVQVDGGGLTSVV